MYIHSGCLGNQNQQTMLFEINDSCWFESNVPVYLNPQNLIRILQYEACVVANLYYKKRLNVPRNLALFYRTKFKKDNSSAPFEQAFRQLMNDRFVINAMIPELKFMARYHKNTVRYVLDPKLT